MTPLRRTFDQLRRLWRRGRGLGGKWLRGRARVCERDGARVQGEDFDVVGRAAVGVGVESVGGEDIYDHPTVVVRIPTREAERDTADMDRDRRDGCGRG